MLDRYHQTLNKRRNLLAWHYADNHRDDYPGEIWWVRGESFVTEIFKYAARMGLAPAPDLAQEREQVQ